MNRYQHLTQEERYMIYHLLRKGKSSRRIADYLDRSPSTVSREIRRNTGLRGYRHKQAQHFCESRRCSSHGTTRISESTTELIVSYLHMDWSPEQISNYLRLEHARSVSTEWIYQLVWQDKFNGGTLYRHLRQHRKKRRKRYGSGYQYRGHLKNRISIDERPDIVDKRERIGDWEIDTMIGKAHKGALVTIVERKSRYTLIAQTDGRTAAEVGIHTENLLTPFKEYVYSITGDNGKEFACHESLSQNLGTTFYFAHPYSPWERGLNENTNGLIRQYIPKGSDISVIKDDATKEIMDKLNRRPRKSLGYRTPEDVFFSEIGFFSPPGKRKGRKKRNTCAVALTN